MDFKFENKMLSIVTVNASTPLIASSSNKVAKGGSDYMNWLSATSSSGYPNAGSLGSSSPPSIPFYPTSQNTMQSFASQNPSSLGSTFRGSEFNSGPSSLQPEASSSEYMYYADAQGGGYDAPQGSAYSTETGLGGNAYFGYPYQYDANADSNVGYDEGLSSVDAGYSTNYGSVDGYTGGFGEEFYGEVESPEPVFSDVSDLEPVSSFSSRSRYQRGRAVYSQTTYTPGEVLPPDVPLSRAPHGGSPKQSGAQTKGGF